MREPSMRMSCPSHCQEEPEMRVQTGLWKLMVAGVAMALLLTAFAGAAFGQSATGALTGTASDAKGLAMVGVSVLVHNADTGVDLKPVATTDIGTYLVPLLPPGNYDITASHAGFASVERKGVHL